MDETTPIKMEIFNRRIKVITHKTLHALVYGVCRDRSLYVEFNMSETKLNHSSSARVKNSGFFL